MNNRRPAVTCRHMRRAMDGDWSWIGHGPGITGQCSAEYVSLIGDNIASQGCQMNERNDCCLGAAR